MMAQPRVRISSARGCGQAIPPYRIKFLDRQESPACHTISIASRRLKFLGPHHALQPSSNAVAHGTARVPELWYSLAAGCNVTTTFSRQACHLLVALCQESNVHGREVGGILVGYHRTAADLESCNHTLLVTDIFPIDPLDSSSDHIAFGERAWRQTEQAIQSRYALEGKFKLGWYHTHPTQGIFFSVHDHAAHGLFKARHQFALVVDPKSMDAGLFHWHGNHSGTTVAGPIRFSLRSDRS